MSKYSSIIMTGGISLFNSSNIYGNASHTYAAFEFNGTNPLLKKGYDLEDTLKKWKNEMLKISRKGKEERISAEYSLLYALKKNNELSSKPNVTIFYTAVEGNKIGGYYSAKLLSNILEKDFGAEVELEKLENFSVTDKKRMKNSISEFMEKVVKALRKHDTYSTFFAPLGGYKVMTSYGYIAGSFAEYPTGYLHEDNQVLHIIPPVPIRLDDKFVEENKEILRKIMINDIVPIEEIRQPFIDKYRFLFEIEEIDKKSYITLNALGKFLFKEKYPHYFSYKIYLDKKIKLTPFIANQIKTLLEKAQDENLSLEDKNYLYHNANLPIQNILNNSGFYLFKSHSHNGIRAIWKIEKNKKELVLPKVWTSHNEYEKDIENQKKIKSYLNNKVADKSEEFYKILNQKQK